MLEHATVSKLDVKKCASSHFERFKNFIYVKGIYGLKKHILMSNKVF